MKSSLRAKSNFNSTMHDATNALAIEISATRSGSVPRFVLSDHLMQSLETLSRSCNAKYLSCLGVRLMAFSL